MKVQLPARYLMAPQETSEALPSHGEPLVSGPGSEPPPLHETAEGAAPLGQQLNLVELQAI
eukprot:8932995-Pyramimonas_sp.AAC.1